MSQPAEKITGKPAVSLKESNFVWEDPLDIESDLTEEERMVRDTARGFAQDFLMPRIREAYATEKYDPAILPKMGELGLLGPTIPGDLWRRGPGLRRLRPDRARDRAGRLRLPLDDVGAVLTRHVSDLRLWHRGAAAANICPSSPTPS